MLQIHFRLLQLTLRVAEQPCLPTSCPLCKPSHIGYILLILQIRESYELRLRIGVCIHHSATAAHFLHKYEHLTSVLLLVNLQHNLNIVGSIR